MHTNNLKELKISRIEVKIYSRKSWRKQRGECSADLLAHDHNAAGSPKSFLLVLFLASAGPPF
jgi:hypothetical protein